MACKSLRWLSLCVYSTVVVFFFYACTVPNSKDEQKPGVEANANEVKALENPSSINANPENISFITIANLDIMSADAGLFSAEAAEKMATQLGNDWRLPDEEELKLLFEQSDDIKNFKTNYYWGCEVTDEDGNQLKTFLRKSMTTGELVVMQTNEELNSVYGVRLVRNHRN